MAREFPLEWKSIYFGRQAIRGDDGIPRYCCPLCQERFDHSGIDDLAGDHVWPFSLFGETSWENYQLLCVRCNSRKSNFVDKDLRTVLGDGTFRDLVAKVLREQVDKGRLATSAFLKQLLQIE